MSRQWRRRIERGEMKQCHRWAHQIYEIHRKRGNWQALKNPKKQSVQDSLRTDAFGIAAAWALAKCLDTSFEFILYENGDPGWDLVWRDFKIEVKLCERRLANPHLRVTPGTRCFTAPHVFALMMRVPDIMGSTVSHGRRYNDITPEFMAMGWLRRNEFYEAMDDYHAPSGDTQKEVGRDGLHDMTSILRLGQDDCEQADIFT